nr:DUF4760 domain-containing protein [uncultured Rhodospira sp.]
MAPNPELVAVATSEQWPPLWALLISPIILFISASAAILLVVLNYNSSERNRRINTMLRIFEIEQGEHYSGIHRTFSFVKQEGLFDRLHSPSSTEFRRMRSDVQQYLNHYELIAIGIQEGVFSDALYKRWMRGPFVRDWNTAADFIQRERWRWDARTGRWIYHAALFENYQAVAKQWSDEAVSLNESYSPPPAAPGGPGDEAYPASDGGTA